MNQVEIKNKLQEIKDILSFKGIYDMNTKIEYLLKYVNDDSKIEHYSL